MFDALIIGGGTAGMSCALVMGSASNKEYAKDKRIGIIAHQRASHLQTALFNNVLGFAPGTLGSNILSQGLEQLSTQYPHIEQISKEKVKSIERQNGHFEIVTNKNTYESKLVVIAVGYAQPFLIRGLESYLAQHPRAAAEKNRIWLKNEDHKIQSGLYVAGTLAGWRSQYAMAAGSGAHVATDILTLWNGGKHTKVHDKIG